MLNLKKIDFDYFCITGFPDGSDWVMGPGYTGVREYGAEGGKLVWFLDRKNRLRVFDAFERKFLCQYIIADSESSTKVKMSRDAKRVFFSRSVGLASDLCMIELENGACTTLCHFEACESIGFDRDIPLIEQQDGKLLVAMHKRGPFDENKDLSTQLLLIDPNTKDVNCCVVERGTGMRFYGSNTGTHPYGLDRLQHPSPDGRYWIRPDPLHLPILETIERKKHFWQRKSSSRHFGLTVQLWEAYPLRFVRHIVVAWLTLEELRSWESDLVQSYPQKAVTLNAEKERNELLELVVKETSVRKDNTGKPIPRIDLSSLLATSDDKWGLLRSELGDIWQKKNVVAWQPDGQAFWFKSNNFLSCCGIDGSVSQRMYLSRHGLQQSKLYPCAEEPEDIRPQNGRRALVEYYRLGRNSSNGVAEIEGKASEFPHNILEIPVEEDRWVAYDKAKSDDIYKRLKKFKRSQSTILIPLSDWSEAGCIAAIEAFTDKVDETLSDKAADFQVQAKFIHRRKTVPEDVFFKAIQEKYPGCAPSIRQLIEKALDTVSESLFWDNEEGVFILGHAAAALGILDKSSFRTLRDYGSWIDIEHETHFPFKTIPAIINQHGWVNEVIDFGIWALMFGFYDGVGRRKIWTEWGLREAAEKNFSPVQFAARVSEVFEETILQTKSDFKTESVSTYVDILAYDFPKPLSQWENEFLLSFEKQKKDQ